MLPNKYGIGNLILPASGPAVCTVTVELNNGSGAVDLTSFMQSTDMKYIQGVCIINDDPNADADISVTVDNGAKHKAVGKIGTITYAPLFVSSGGYQFQVQAVGNSSPAVTQIVLHFYNVPIQPCVFGAVAEGDAPSSIEYEYVEDVVTLAGNTILLAAGDAQLSGATIANPSTNDPVIINLAGGDAETSGIELAPGGTIVLDSISNQITGAGTDAETVTVYHKELV